MVIAPVTAMPRHDTSKTARVDPARVRSNTDPSLADSTGNVLSTIDSASTAFRELNTCDGVAEDHQRAGLSAAVGQGDHGDVR